MTDSTTIEQPDESIERADWLAWRRQREEGLCAPYGWLSQTGLYWLQALGGFRAVIPGINGEWLLKDGEVMFTPQPSGESGKGADGGAGDQSAVLTLVDAKGDRTPITGPVRVPSDATANGSCVEAGQIRAAVIERGGRFLNATVAADTDGTAADEKSDVLLDFNRAFNPPCAFSPYCTCPLAPAENTVTVPVTAGERH